MSKLFDQLISVRNIGPDFLDPRYQDLVDPFLLPDMELAVERIRQAIVSQEKILIYGDYDVDGVTASTVMEEALRLAGVRPENISIMLPDRFVDGYGMSKKIIASAKQQQVQLVITVDCGSRNHDIIAELGKIGIDVVVTDHHETDPAPPSAIAILNPHRKDRPCPRLQNLAGVGVAFKLAQALTAKNLIRAGQEKWLLDLVLIGTVCDSMTLVGENRILGFFGLKVLNKTRRPGLQELIRRAKIKQINSESIGFGIGPRLNAAGRLETADLALNLLRTKSSLEAASLVEKLEHLNQKRKTEQKKATKEISERGSQDAAVIIESGNWHEGILGIVAGRLVEQYHKPAFVLSEVEPGTLKGSGRSFGDFNLAEALQSTSDIIIGGGGHAAAAGVKLSSDRLNDFRQCINSYYRGLSLTNQERYFRVKPDLSINNLSDLSLDFLAELKRLEPFGTGNEEPIFCLKNIQIAEIRKMGAEENHLRLDVRDKHGNAIKLVAFFAPHDWLNLDYEAKIEPIIKLVENDFNGIKSPEAQILDIIIEP